jgi:hypothetical protein
VAAVEARKEGLPILGDSPLWRSLTGESVQKLGDGVTPSWIALA